VARFDRAIPPGGEGRITLKVDLKGYQGKVVKSASVTSNDSRNPRLTLTVNLTVKALIEVRPTNSVFFRGLADQQTERAIDLVASSQPFHITRTESNLGDKIAHQVETVEEGKLYRLKISNRLQQGSYAGFVKLHTDLVEKNEVVVRVSGSIEGEISVSPKSIPVGKLAAKQPVSSGKVQVVSNSHKPFQISGLSYDQQLIRVSQEALPNQSGYSLEITPVMENTPAGKRSQTTLVIETDTAPGGKLEVQVQIHNALDTPIPPPSVKPRRSPDPAPGESVK
jgi:hypothetical protein